VKRDNLQSYTGVKKVTLTEDILCLVINSHDLPEL